jgi:transposase, IS5 family
MLRLVGPQVECLFDLGLPVEVPELPADLAAIDRLLDDPSVLAPVVAAWDARSREHGRPTVPMDRYVRLMVIKTRTGWGYETLVREVADSLHLRRFCRIALTERVPDESTIRKLTRRLGSDVVNEMTRLVIGREVAERRFEARAVRVDSTVVEADVRYPNDAALAADATRVLAREAKMVAGLAGNRARAVRDRSRSAARKLREISRTVARRTGEAKSTVLRLTGEAGALVKQTTRESRRLAQQLRARARGRGAQAKLHAARRLDELADRADKIARQIDQRLAGERITDRLVSMFDPDARPIRKGKLRAPTEFGYVFQLAEITENTRRGARGLLLPAATRPGNPAENTLLADTAAELNRLGVIARDVALDAGFNPGPTAAALPDSDRVFIAGRQSTGSRHTDRRLAKYRVGCEGRISHLKRRYGTRRSRLKGHDGARTTVGWSVLTYNLDTLAIRAA